MRKYAGGFRLNIGTVPMHMAKNIQKKFLVSPHKKFAKIVLRGRGERPQGCKSDLPLRLAKEAAIYIDFKVANICDTCVNRMICLTDTITRCSIDSLLMDETE